MMRLVCPEILDELPQSDPAAQRSRRDLRRVNWALGSRRIVTRALLLRLRSQSPTLRVLELGAGDGDFLLGVARSVGARWGRVHATLLDRQNLLETPTQTAYAALGWQVESMMTDVLAWAADPPSPCKRWDLIIANLFLHHFEGSALLRILEAVEARADLFLACEPRRSLVSLIGSRLIGALGVNAVTRNDAVVSVKAGFRDKELSEQWPDRAQRWSLEEFAAGAFSHCFVAKRCASQYVQDGHVAAL